MAKIEEFIKSSLNDKRKNASKFKPNEITDLIDEFVKFNPLKNDWIKKGADQSLSESAEVIGKFLAPYSRDDKDALTNSQIRNVFGEIKRIQMGGFEKNKSAFYILKPKVAYAAGRHNKLGILTFKKYFDLAISQVENENDYYNFCNFLEAIVAYHKAYGGKD